MLSELEFEDSMKRAFVKEYLLRHATPIATQNGFSAYEIVARALDVYAAYRSSFPYFVDQVSKVVT